MAYTEVEIFLPAGDASDPEREEFLNSAVDLAERGFPITVYVRGEDEWAFEQCEHVADMLSASGDQVLPITLLGPQIVASWQYPTAEQMERFARAAQPQPKDPRFSSAASACGPGPAAMAQLRGNGASAGSGTPAPAPEPAGFAAVLAGKPQQPAGGPEIGGRRNLMSGDTGSGLPRSSGLPRDEQQTTTGGDCCGGSCGCGGH